MKRRSYRIREIPKSIRCGLQMEMAMWRDRQTGKRVTWLWGVVELQAKGCQGLQAITGSQEMGMEQSFLPRSQGQHGLADLQLWFPVCGGAPKLWENTFLLSEGSLLWLASKTNATLVGYLHLSDQGSDGGIARTRQLVGKTFEESQVLWAIAWKIHHVF